MKKVVPFTKTISFRTMIAEITDIEVNHTLALNENHEVVGDILVDGKFEEDKKNITLTLRGSSNQRIIDVKETFKENKLVLFDLENK